MNNTPHPPRARLLARRRRRRRRARARLGAERPRRRRSPPAAGARAACRSGPGAPAEAAPTGYTGPKVALPFWNGFTGGDGPFMKQLVDQFNAEHPNIEVTMNTMQWADYYQKLPAAGDHRQRPRHRHHARRLGRHQRRPRRHPAARRRRHRARAQRGRLRRRCGRPGSTTASATASRSTCTRSACSTTRRSWRRPGSTRRSRRRPPTTTWPRSRAQGQGHPGPLGHPVPVHRRAAVPVADLAVRRRRSSTRTPPRRSGPRTPASRR